MEMKLAVASDLQLFKSLEAAQWPDEVEATWSAHEKIAGTFTVLGRARHRMTDFNDARTGVFAELDLLYCA